MQPFIPPQLVSRSRKDEKSVHAGDCASLELVPNTLNTMMTGEVPPGRGLHPLSSVPFGLAVDAAIQACGKGITGMDVLKAAEVSLPEKLDRTLSLFAEASVSKLSRRSAECGVSVFQKLPSGKAEIMKARIILVCVIDGKASDVLLTGVKILP